RIKSPPPRDMLRHPTTFHDLSRQVLAVHFAVHFAVHLAVHSPAAGPLARCTVDFGTSRWSQCPPTSSRKLIYRLRQSPKSSAGLWQPKSGVPRWPQLFGKVMPNCETKTTRLTA